MTIAWPAIALLVVLLPGFVFFAGLSAPHRFSRDAETQSIIGKLAAIVLVSFTVHSLLITVTNDVLARHTSISRVDLGMVLTAFHLGTQGAITPQMLGENLGEHRLEIFLYLISSVVCGFFLGFGVIRFAVWAALPSYERKGTHHPARRLFSCLLDPTWVYELSTRRPRWYLDTYAYLLMTLPGEKDHYALYKGPIHYFGLNTDRTLAYIVLENPERRFLHFAPTGQLPELASTEAIDDWYPIEQDLLYADMKNVSNVVFERYGVPIQKSETETLKTVQAWAPPRIGPMPPPSSLP